MNQYQNVNSKSIIDFNYKESNKANYKYNNKNEDVANKDSSSSRNFINNAKKLNDIKDHIYSPENININMNINEEINQNDKISKNHEISSTCINECIVWTLKAQINSGKSNNNNQKDSKYNYLFEGQSIFFPKLEFSVLNAFNNSLCFEKCFDNSNKTYFDNKKKILIKLKQESNKQIKDIDIKNYITNSSENACIQDILENEYPINNKNNFNILDNNLCLKQNLANVFLLKFDLINEHNKNNDFRAINDNCVGREIYFMF